MSNINFKKAILLVVIAILLPGPLVAAEEDAAAKLANKLANPIANLISVPIRPREARKIGVHDSSSLFCPQNSGLNV